MIKKLLKNNRAAQRFKAVKDLFLEKLDYLRENSDYIKNSALKNHHATSTSLNAISTSLDAQTHNTNQLLENQIFFIKSALDQTRTLQHLVESGQQQQAAVEQMMENHHAEIGGIRQEFVKVRQESQSYYELLINKFLDLEKDNQIQANFTREKLAEIAADVHDQKFKVITDSKYFQAIDIELMAYLYSYLPHRRAIDVGANRGDVSTRLLQAGYEVYAFEPFPPVLENLQERLGNNSNFHALGYALGATHETKDLHLAVDQTEDGIYDDATFYNSLTPHSLSEGLIFTKTIPVPVKTLASLHESGEIPHDIGLVKIDTEGFDLEVIRGMGDFRYPVVLAEFWDPSFPFGQEGALNYLKDLVPAMRERGYGWHIIIYRIWGNHDISYYCNSDYSLENSWGNVFFFQDYKIFNEALKWCSSTMPATYFSV